MKRQLADLANGLLRPLGAAVYRSGFTMEDALLRIGASDAGARIRSVIDIGASNGRWSELALRALPSAKVLGIDPLKERESDLKALAAKEKGRFSYELAVAGRDPVSSIALCVTDDLDGSTIGAGHGTERTVPSHSLDYLAKEHKLGGPFLVKFDTHGHEVPIMDGAEAVLAETSHIIMECYNFRHVPGTLLFHEMVALMADKGFRCFDLVEPLHRPSDGSLWQMDLFFTRADDVRFTRETYD